jgi:hypothetical protein
MFYVPQDTFHRTKSLCPKKERMFLRRNAYGLLVGKPEGRRPRRKWMDNIRMDTLDGVMWTGLVWLRIGAGGELL